LLSRIRSIPRRFRAAAFPIGLLALLALFYRPPLAQLVPPLAAPPLAAPEMGYPMASGQTLFVPANGDLQAALDKASGGDVIVLEAGAQFVGSFTLPRKTGADWVIIRSASHQSLPPPGVRISPEDSKLLPKIITSNGAPAIGAEAGAHHFHFIGVEIGASSIRSTAAGALVQLQSPNGTDADTPSDIIFDRCYIHGGGARTGLALGSARTIVVDSYLSDFRDAATDSQAISVDGPGPFKIVNNYLAAAAENLVLGATEGRGGATPADIEIRGNYFYKPLAWRADAVSRPVRNLLALKRAERVLIENNVFENNWGTDDKGFAVLVAAESNSAGVQDVTFRKNIVRQSAAGVGIMGQTAEFPNRQTRRVLIQDNLFDQIGGTIWGGSGVLFQIFGGTADVVIDHNTGLQSGKALSTDAATHTGFVYQNNIALDNESAGALVYGEAWAARFPGFVFARNVLTGGTPAAYPAENFFPRSPSDVGFVNATSGDYRLSAASPYSNAGTDGANIGADYETVQAAAAEAVSGGRNS
jgi:hypothetical protein